MKKIIISAIALILLTGCTNEKVFRKSLDYKYISCSEDYLNIKNVPITSYWTHSSSERIEVNTDIGSLIVSSNQCVLSDVKLGD